MKQISANPTSSTIIVRSPRLDALSGRALIREVEGYLTKPPQTLVLDLSAVEHLDSMGVAALVSIRRRAPSTTKIVLAGLRGYALNVARVTRLNEVFDIFTTAEAAQRGKAS